MDESREETNLHNLLQQHPPNRSGSDTLVWDQCNNFSVRNLYAKAVTQVERGGSVDRLVCSVWQKLVPPKVELMVWLALLGKLNTKDRLVRKRMLPMKLNQCTFCHNHSENIDHVLMSCTVAWTIWQFIAEELGEQIENEDTLRSLYAAWLSKRFPNKTRRKLWLSSFFATLWSLWMHRNGIIFKKHVLDVQTLCHMIKWRVATWSKAWNERIPYSAGMMAQNFQALPLLFN